MADEETNIRILKRGTACKVVTTAPADYSPPIQYPAIRPWLPGTECNSIN
ncbi:MAG TPA: hypothetical protein VKB89_20685 [Xanthobacteraceae bacterium]|nr:hypothetical protein [Xanthobacteraceae bacterium]